MSESSDGDGFGWAWLICALILLALVFFPVVDQPYPLTPDEPTGTEDYLRDYDLRMKDMG